MEALYADSEGFNGVTHHVDMSVIGRLFVPDYDCQSQGNGKFRLCRQQRSFAQIADATNLRDNILSESFGIGAIRDIDVPEELAAAGINSIVADVNDRVIYFEYAEGIMWVTGFGILYAAYEPDLPEWYRLEPIEDHWYFYRVVS